MSENTQGFIEKSKLQVGYYYIGTCRNASLARWDGERFTYWRYKFGNWFLEEICHPEDDQTYDTFKPKYVCAPTDIPIT